MITWQVAKVSDIGEEAEEEEMGQTEPVGPSSLPGCLLQVDERVGPTSSPRWGMVTGGFSPFLTLSSAETGNDTFLVGPP